MSSTGSSNYHAIDVEGFKRTIIERAQLPPLRRNRSPVVSTTSRRRPQSYVSPMIATTTTDSQHQQQQQRSITNDPILFVPSKTSEHLSHQLQQHQQIAVDRRGGSSMTVTSTNSATYAVPETTGSSRDDRNRSNEDERQRRLIDVSANANVASSHRDQVVSMMPLESNNVDGSGVRWQGQRLNGKAIEPLAPPIKNYWTDSIQRVDNNIDHSATSNNYRRAHHPSQQQQQQQYHQVHEPTPTPPPPLPPIGHRKPYQFPRWRSNDALTASLIASKLNIKYPAGSRQPPPEPPYELPKSEQQSAKHHHPLVKGKSLDSLTMQLDYQPWYDKNRIREAISRESIANLELTRKFEARSVASAALSPPPTTPHTRMQQYDISTPSRRADKGTTTLLYHQPTNESPQSNIVDNYSNGNTNDDQYHGNMEQQLFMQYIKSNIDIVGSLGIVLPNALKQRLDRLPFRRVELRPVYESPTNGNNYYESASMERAGGQNGRFIKNTAVGSQRVIARKTYADLSLSRQIPENKKPMMQELDDQKAGESLIAAEIRSLREREDELRRSRSELGLPTLEDTIDYWRNGMQSKPMMPPLRGAVSYDHLHQAVASAAAQQQQQPMQLINNGGDSYSLSNKSGSLTHLHIHDQHDQPIRRAVAPSNGINEHNGKHHHREERNQSLRSVTIDGGGINRLVIDESTMPREYVGQRNQNFRPAYSSTGYKLHKSDDPDVMIYGPSTTNTRNNRNNGSSTVHIINSPTMTNGGMRSVRYE